jgi:hypothetical protein
LKLDRLSGLKRLNPCTHVISSRDSVEASEPSVNSLPKGRYETYVGKLYSHVRNIADRLMAKEGAYEVRIAANL